MKHIVTVKCMGGPTGFVPPKPKAYVVEADDPMAAHGDAAKRFRTEELGDRIIPGTWFLTAREET